METLTKAYESRFGYHPCTRETCLKLKEAHLLLLRALRDIKRHDHWESKQEPVGEEPRYPSFVCKNGYFHRSQKAKDEGRMTYGATLGTSAWPVGYGCQIHYYEHVLSQYRNARRPKETAEEVQALDLPSDLWEVVEKLKGFYGISPEAE